MAMTFRYEYPKLKFLSENIATQNIKYFAASVLSPTFNLSLHEYSPEKRLPDITCSLSKVADLDGSNNFLYEQIKDDIGLIKYRNKYFTYDTERKTFVHIKSHYMLETYLSSLVYSTYNYFVTVGLPSVDLILYKINAYEIYYK